MKISFSLPSNASSSKPNPIKPLTSLDDDQFNSDAVASVEYNHQFTAVAIDVDPTVPRVIPHIPNEWQPNSGKKKIIVKSEEAVLKEEFKRLLKHIGVKEFENYLVEAVLKEEFKRLLKHIGVKEFENYLVEGFWEALLAGYEWQPKRGIDKNAEEDVGVVEFQANVGRKGHMGR